MKHLYLLLIGAVLLSSCGRFVAPLQHAGPTPADTLKALHARLQGYPEKYARHDAVFLLSDELRDHHSNGYTQHVKLRYLVLKPDEEWLTTFRVSLEYDEELSDVTITVSSPDGSVRTFGKTDLRSETSSDNSTVWKLAYPNVVRGTIIEEDYTIERSSGRVEWSHDVVLQRSVPCDSLRFRYSFPSWWTVQVKDNGVAANVAYTTESDRKGNKKTFVYEAANVPSRETEPYSPYYKEIGKYMEFMVRTTMDVNMSGYSSDRAWRYFAGQYTQHVLDKESFWSGAVRSTTDEITEQCSTDVQRLEAVTTYLQQNIRVGSSSEDETFSDVLEKKEANPYVITGLAKKMLEKLDITADFILIHSARDGYFDPGYVTADQLYIPALYTTIDNTQYVVFPYYKNVPIDLLPEPFQRQQALRINEDGYNGFMTTPKGRDIDNTTDERYTLTIDEEGKITVEEEKTLRGFTAFNVRDRLDNLKPEEVEKEMKELLTYTEGDIKLLSHEVQNRTELRKPLVIRLKYEIDNLVTVTPEEVIFQTAGLLSPSSGYAKKADTTERQNPIRVYYTETLNKDITIRYPQHWNPTTPMQDKKFENTFGMIESTVQTRPGELKVQQKRVLNQISESKEKYRDLLQIIGRNSRLAIPTVIFSAQGS